MLDYRMTYLPKIVLHCPTGYRPELNDLVEQFISDGVQFVGVVGTDCALVEDIIDELVVGDGTNPNRFILTSSHPNDLLEIAIDFAMSLTEEYVGEIQVVEL